MNKKNTEKAVALKPSEHFQRNILFAHKGKAISNYLGSDKKRLMKFLTGVGTAIERTPKLLECDQESVMQAFVNAASFDLDPSGISGECYVLPYKGKGQFQLAYKGLVTMMYRNGIDNIVSGIVREKDTIKLVDGNIQHEVDPFLSKEERGVAIGAYVKVTFNGKTVSKFMNGKDIMAHGKKFSKSFNSEYSPWKEKNDPELWMWVKTVLIQLSKLLPLGDSLKKAINIDYQDSVVHDRMEKAKQQSKTIEMGNLLTKPKDAKDKAKEGKTTEEVEKPADSSTEA